jgi:hypothetical protein
MLNRFTFISPLRIVKFFTCNNFLDMYNEFILGSGCIFELLLYCFVWIGTTMARAEVLKENGGFDEVLRGTEDYDLWIRLMGKMRFGYIKSAIAAAFVISCLFLLISAHRFPDPFSVLITTT